MSPENINYVHNAAESRGMSDDDRLLTEVNHLINGRLAPGVFDSKVVEGVSQNIVTAVQEQSMPFAVTTTRHEAVIDSERRLRTFMWLGKTAVQVAMSGYQYHNHESAIKRVDVEVDEARSVSSMTEDIARVLVSPRMTRKDASLVVAQNEHLADDDSIRVSWLDSTSGKTERVMQSLLVRDIPIDAWVAMLKDPNNIFGKSISVEDEESALSVMKIHGQLEVPISALPKGPISIIEAVYPYIKDETARKTVGDQLKRYSLADQNELKRKAEETSRKWLEFDMQLAESLVTGRATDKVRSEIILLQTLWGREDLAVINEHSLGNTQYRMTRELAAVLESAKQKLLNDLSSVSTGNVYAIDQVKDKQAIQRILDNEKIIFISRMQGLDTHILESQQIREIASLNIETKGGCPGRNRTKFDDADDPLQGVTSNDSESKNEEDAKENWVWKDGVCQVEACSSRPGKTKVGPCSVCKKCQAVFDSGGDPTKDKPIFFKPEEPERKIGIVQVKDLKAQKVAKIALGSSETSNEQIKVENEQFTLAA